MKKNQFLKVVTYYIYCNIIVTCRVNDNRFFSVTIVILTEICVQTGGWLKTKFIYCVNLIIYLFQL